MNILNIINYMSVFKFPIDIKHLECKSEIIYQRFIRKCKNIEFYHKLQHLFPLKHYDGASGRDYNFNSIIDGVFKTIQREINELEKEDANTLCWSIRVGERDWEEGVLDLGEVISDENIFIKYCFGIVFNLMVIEHRDWCLSKKSYQILEDIVNNDTNLIGDKLSNQTVNNVQTI